MGFANHKQGKADGVRRLARGAAILAVSAWVAVARAEGPEAELLLNPSEISLADAATMTLVLRNAGNAPGPEIKVDGLQIEYRGASSSFNMVNGRVDRSQSFEYSVSASAPGSYTIGPFQYDYQGQKISIPQVVLKVTADGGTGENAASLSEMLFARVETPRSKVFVQEDFPVTISVFSRGVLLDPHIQLFGLPEGVMRIDSWQEVSGGQEEVDGKMYEVRRFRGQARALTPTTLNFQPGLKVQIRQPSARRSSRDPFTSFREDFFSGTLFDRTPRRTAEVRCPPLAMTIAPLPEEGRPPSFSGAIGDVFRFDTTVSPPSVEAGAPVTIRTEISGRGNLDGIRPPSAAFGEEFRAYDPRPVNGTAAPAGVAQRVFEQVVIPRDENVRALPCIEFSYFNPQRGVYEILRKGPFPIRVSPAATRAVPEPGAGLVEPPPAGQELVRGADILYLKTEPIPCGPVIPGSAVFYGIGVGLPPLATALLGLGLWQRARRSRDIRGLRRRTAPRAARAALQRAQAAIRAGDGIRFYGALSAALFDYAGHRLNLAPGEVTAEIVCRLMSPVAEEGVPVESLLQECDAARFGGFRASGPAMERRLDQVRTLLSRCEKRSPVSGENPR